MIINEFNIELINKYFPTILLYAELHFRFKFCGSRYFKQEPEILSDIPIRVEPGEKLPILLIIKDAHLFPVKLLKVDITFYKSDFIIHTFNKIYHILIESNWWDDTLFIPVNDLKGNIEIDVEFTYEINNKKKKCHIHNYPLCDHEKMQTFISEHQFPNDGNVIYGDLHYHSNLTEDMVEFGAPMKATLDIAKAMGLDFFCNTDHSYDLDDIPGSWTKTDPKLEKWNNSRNEIVTLNSQKLNSSFIIPSEELSLHNLDRRNIHALILNNNAFLPGAGDSAEKPFHFEAEYNTQNLHNNLDDNSLCIAAHPFNSVPFLQRLFFKRGKWKKKDIIHKNMIGLQILNGSFDKEFFLGIKIWIKLLLEGYHKFIYAGNDAHGNFNIFRQINIPMLTLIEKKEQLFGKYRTGVITEGKIKDVDVAIYSLKKGNCFITAGPLINMICITNKQNYNMGSSIHSNFGLLQISVISTPEFGTIKNIVIKKGVIGKDKETDFFTVTNLKQFRFNFDIDIYISVGCYYRCEAEFGENENNRILTFSNPIWLIPVK